MQHHYNIRGIPVLAGEKVIRVIGDHFPLQTTPKGVPEPHILQPICTAAKTLVSLSFPSQSGEGKVREIHEAHDMVDTGKISGQIT